MKRKLVKQGNRALTVTLPSKWIEEHNLKQGDELSVISEKNKISFLNIVEQDKPTKEITLDIEKYTWYQLCRVMTILYRTNYDRIILLYKKDILFHDKQMKDFPIKERIQCVVGRFIGMDIVSQSNNKTEIECFLGDTKHDLEKIEKRIYFLLKDLADELLLAIYGDFSAYKENIYDSHDNINRFTNYFLREVNYSKWNDYEKSYAYSFYLMIDKVVDLIKHLTETIARIGISDKAKIYLKEIFGLFFEQFKLFSKPSKLAELGKHRYELVERIENENFTKDEILIVSRIYLMLYVMNDFQEFSLVKKINDLDKIYD